MFVINMLPITHHNKSYDFENNDKYRQRSKKFSRNAKRKCRSHLNHNLFYKNFIYDPLDVFIKPMGTINIKIRRLDFKRNQNFGKFFWKL